MAIPAGVDSPQTPAASWPSKADCQAVLLPAPEDITIDHDHGRAYISSQAAVRGLFGGPANAVEGGIFALDLETPARPPKLYNLTAHVKDGPRRFHPLGLDLWVDGDGPARLFVINRTGDHHSRVEVFQVDRSFDLGKLGQAGDAPSPLRYCGYVADDLHLMAPNGIAAIAMDAFLVTNMSRFRHELLRNFDNLPLLGGGSVVHCAFGAAAPSDPAGRLSRSAAPAELQHFDAYSESQDQRRRLVADFRFLDDGLRYANGIAVTGAPKSRQVYVASTLDRKILCYDWDGRPDRSGFAFTRAIELSAAPDNLKWDRSGDLWLGAHPSLPKLVLYMAAGSDHSPSRVLRISGLSAGQPVVHQVLDDDGRLISASSAAVHYESGATKVLLIGSAFQDRLLICS